MTILLIKEQLSNSILNTEKDLCIAVKKLTKYN